MSFLDFVLGGFRLWRRMRGGRWADVFHVPSCAVVGWIRLDPEKHGRELMGCHVSAVEEYRLPRAKAPP